MKIFETRTTAGQALAKRLVENNYADPVILALPRGGLPVAIEVVRALRAPMDLVMVRKIGAPGQHELAVGAVINGEDPQFVVNEHVARAFGLSRAEIQKLAEPELEEIRRRRAVYFQGLPQVSVKGCTAIVVDDGIATGATMRASLIAIRRRAPARIVLAVPVAPADTLAEMRKDVDEVICLETPDPFWAIGAHYENFSQTSDDDVIRLLQEAKEIVKGDRG